MSDVNTDNDFLLAVGDRGIAPLLPLKVSSKQQAFRAAAWLVLMAELLPDEEPASTFDEVLEAISNT